MPRFGRYIGIDYSGAATPTSRLSSLRVFVATPARAPREEPPPSGAGKYWTRRALAEWLVARLNEPARTIAGIDHAFSFPIAYFERHELARDWPAFLDDFHRHWPTDHDHMYVDFIREGIDGNGAARGGSRYWRRLTDLVAGSAKSAFLFDVQGSVAKSTHAGLPWLRHIRQHASPCFWPFDAWTIPPGRSAVVEVYPRLWNRRPRPPEWTADQFDAFVIAEWLRKADADGRLARALGAPSDEEVRALASIEGWILGVDPKQVTPEILAKYAESATRRGKSSKFGRRRVALDLRSHEAMPELSRFYGIVVTMYYREHGQPHFHATYAGRRVSIDIATGTIEGRLAPVATRLVLEWLDRHRAELLENWSRAKARQPLQPIAPLE